MPTPSASEPRPDRLSGRAGWVERRSSRTTARRGSDAVERCRMPERSEGFEGGGSSSFELEQAQQAESDCEVGESDAGLGC
jgi:hypothetical protein